MKLKIGKKKYVRLSKRAFFGVLFFLIGLTVFLCLLPHVVRFLFPEDNYLTTFAHLSVTSQPYNHTAEPLDRSSPGELGMLGVSPVPPYVPSGYEPESAEYLENGNLPDDADGRAVRLTYVNTKDSKKTFSVTVSGGGLLQVYTEQAMYDNPFLYSDGNLRRWAVFGGQDVIVYENSSEYFARFTAEGREWLAVFRHMSKKDVRLVITSVITRSPDPEGGE